MSTKRAKDEKEEEVESIDIKRRRVSKSSLVNIDRIPMDVMRRSFEFLMNHREMHKDLARVCRTNKQFYRVFRNLVPPTTIYIAANTGNDSKGDGTILNPFRSMEPLYEKNFWRSREKLKLSGKHDEETTVQIIHCNRSECEVMICNQDGCSNKVCREHKNGSGIYDRHMNEWRFDEYAVCSVKNCNVAFCEMHYKDGPMGYIGLTPIGRSTRLQGCSVCENFMSAQSSLLGWSNVRAVKPLCTGHAKQCRMVWIESEESWYHPEDEHCGDFDPEEWDQENICGFICCPECIDRHRCGDDPTEYV